MVQEPVISVFDQLEAERQAEYATVGQRFGNYLIDIVVYYIFNYTIAFLVGVALVASGAGDDELNDFAGNRLYMIALSFVNMLVIYALVEGLTKGRTLGKILTGTVAVQEDLLPITWRQAFMRSLIRIIPFEPFSAFGGHPWHDKWTKTMVVKKSSL